MAKEMRALSFSRLHARKGVLLLACASAACSNGLVELAWLSEGGSGADAGSQGQAGSGGRGGGGTGNSGGRSGAPFPEPRAGAGGSGMSRVPPTPCDGLWEIDAENALRDAFNEAVSDGRVCPREATGIRRPLVDDPELQWQARFAICSFPQGRNGWGSIPRSPTLGWVLYDTTSLEDAKKALLDTDDRSILCDRAQDSGTTFRAIGVAHIGDSWSVFVSPGGPEDMRRDDPQKP